MNECVLSSECVSPVAPLFIPPRLLGGQKRESGRGRTKQGETHALAVRAVCPGKCSLSVSTAQASDTLTVPTLMTQHMKQCLCGNLFRKCSLSCRTATEEALREATFQCRGSSTANRLHVSCCSFSVESSKEMKILTKWCLYSIYVRAATQT